jgi:hypothetical protein
VAHELGILERKGQSRAASAARATVATAAATADDTFGLQSDANEALLLHGSPVGRLLSVLATGINERFSGSNAGTAFGDGIYLAEDIGTSRPLPPAPLAWDAGRAAPCPQHHSHGMPGEPPCAPSTSTRMECRELAVHCQR